MLPGSPLQIFVHRLNEPVLSIAIFD